MGACECDLTPFPPRPVSLVKIKKIFKKTLNNQIITASRISYFMPKVMMNEQSLMNGLKFPGKLEKFDP